MFAMRGPGIIQFFHRTPQVTLGQQAERVDMPDQARAPGRQVKLTVKGGVEFCECGRGCGLHPGLDGLCRSDLCIAEMGHRAAERQGFGGDAHFAQLDQIGDAQARDPRGLVRLDLHQPIMFQKTQGLAHRQAADGESRGDLLLSQRRLGGQDARQDVGTQGGGDLGGLFAAYREGRTHTGLSLVLPNSVSKK